MAGKKFLNPYVKIILCSLGIVVMGYFLYQNIQAGELYVGTPLIRALAFVAFLYLLIQTLRDLLGHRNQNGET